MYFELVNDSEFSLSRLPCSVINLCFSVCLISHGAMKECRYFLLKLRNN